MPVDRRLQHFEVLWDEPAPTLLCDPATRTPGPEDPSRSQGPLARMTSAEEAFAGI